MKPYQERFLNEYVELYDKRNKLSNIIEKAMNKELNFTLSCPLELLQSQCAVMDAYLCILKQRVKYEYLQTELEEAMYKFFKSKGGSVYGTICKEEDQGV